jgi:hypothetical protein
MVDNFEPKVDWKPIKKFTHKEWKFTLKESMMMLPYKRELSTPKILVVWKIMNHTKKLHVN